MQRSDASTGSRISSESKWIWQRGCEQDRACNCDFIVNSTLRLERFHLVVEERIFFAILSARSAAHHDNRRLLGIRPSGRVQNIESADALRDANQTDPIDAGVSVCGKTRSGLVRHRDILDLRFIQPGKCRQGKVPWNTETVAEAAPVEVFEQKLA